MHALTKYLDTKEVHYKISGSSLSIQFETVLKPVEEEEEDEEEKKTDASDEVPAICKVRIFKCDEEKNAGVHCIDFSYQHKTTKKNLNRDERVPFNFKELREEKGLVDFYDATFTSTQ